MLLGLVVWLACSPVTDGWKEAGRNSGVIVYTRQHHGGPKSEVLGVGVIDAPPWVVKNAIDDCGATTGRMPYLKEARVLKRDARGVIVYNRTSAPIISDRDYTIRMTDESFVRPDGSVVYVVHWADADQEGPPERLGVVRVRDTEGEWRFEPMNGGTRTRAMYRVFADPAGVVPDTVALWGTTMVIGGIFEAVRVRATDPKYSENKPPLPTRHAPAAH